MGPHAAAAASALGISPASPIFGLVGQPVVTAPRASPSSSATATVAPRPSPVPISFAAFPSPGVVDPLSPAVIGGSVAAGAIVLIALVLFAVVVIPKWKRRSASSVAAARAKRANTSPGDGRRVNGFLTVLGSTGRQPSAGIAAESKAQPADAGFLRGGSVSSARTMVTVPRADATHGGPSPRHTLPPHLPSFAWSDGLATNPPVMTSRAQSPTRYAAVLSSYSYASPRAVASPETLPMHQSPSRPGHRFYADSPFLADEYGNTAPTPRSPPRPILRGSSPRVVSPRTQTPPAARLQPIAVSPLARPMDPGYLLRESRGYRVRGSSSARAMPPLQEHQSAAPVHNHSSPRSARPLGAIDGSSSATASRGMRVPPRSPMGPSQRTALVDDL